MTSVQATAILVPFLLLGSAMAVGDEEFDEVSLRKARDAVAAGVYRVVAPEVAGLLSKRKLAQDAQDRLVLTTVSFVAECVVADLVARPVQGSDRLLRSLVALPADVPMTEVVSLGYGDEAAEELWLHVDDLVESCAERAYEILDLRE